MAKYADDRNDLGESGTSMLSVHFTSGTLSARQAVSAARAANSTTSLDRGCRGIQTYTYLVPLREQILPLTTPPLHSWISEVAWRDFYKHVLANWPYVWLAFPSLSPFSTFSQTSLTLFFFPSKHEQTLQNTLLANTLAADFGLPL